MRERPKLGEILVRAGVIDPIQLKSALGEQQRWGNRLGMTLVNMGLLDEATLVRTLAAQLELPMARLTGKRIAKDVLELVPAEVAQKHHCLPLFVKEEDVGLRCLHVGMEDLSNLAALDELAFQIGMRIRPVLVAPTELGEAIERHYGVHAEFDAPEWTEPEPEVEGDEVFVSDPEEPPGGAAADPEPSFATPSPGSGGASGGGPIPPAAVLRAIAQLLIEKGVLSRDELIERVRAVASGRDEL